MLPAIQASGQIAGLFAMLKTQFEAVSSPETGPDAFAQFVKSFESRLLPADESDQDLGQVAALMTFIADDANIWLGTLRNSYGKRPAPPSETEGSESGNCLRTIADF